MKKLLVLLLLLFSLNNTRWLIVNGDGYSLFFYEDSVFLMDINENQSYLPDVHYNALGVFKGSFIEGSVKYSFYGKCFPTGVGFVTACQSDYGCTINRIINIGEVQ
jgi:hypothetical protein